MQRCRIIRNVTTGIYAVYLSTAGCESKWHIISRDIDTGMSCLHVETVVRSYNVYKVLWEPRVGKTFIALHEILNRDQLVKYLGYPLPEFEIIYIPHLCEGMPKS